MISITVHHHHSQQQQQQQQQPFAGASRSCCLAERPAHQFGHHHQHQLPTSNVEVHYSPASMIKVASTKQASTMTDRLPFGSGGSRSNSESNAENIDHQQQQQQRRHIIKTEQRSQQQFNAQQISKQQQYSKTDEDIDSQGNGARRHGQLPHARSISLIVNPEFAVASSCSESDSSEFTHCKRRVLPRLERRTRQLQAPAAAAAASNETATSSEQLQIGSCNETTAAAAAATQAAKQPVATFNDETTETTSHQDDSHEAEAEALRQAESCARLRETGAFLRQISDQFSKARRHTI